MNQNDHVENDQLDLDRLHAAVKREKPDVMPGRDPLPMWVNLCIWAVLILSGGYLGAYTHVGGFSFSNSNPFPDNPLDERPVPHGPEAQLDPFQTAMKKGANTFNTCAGCHQATGLGLPGSIPPLAGSEWVNGGTERTARIVLNGLIGPVTVKGGNFNYAGGMPAQGASFSDQELANVLTYIRNSWGNQGTMVTKEMVAKVREASAEHKGQWTHELLLPFAEKNIPGEIPAGPGATVAPAAPGAAPAPAK